MATGDDERRRDSRYPCAIAVVFTEKAISVDMITADVSRHGAFVLTDNPRSERTLLHLRFDLGTHGHVEVMARVARRISPETSTPGQTSGMGVDFFAMASEAKRRWDAFVLQRRNEHLAVHPARMFPALPGVLPRMQRKYSRHHSCFLVRIPGKDGLREWYTRDISGGGMFLHTPEPNNVAEDIELILVHPETEQEFPLDSRVVRVVDADDPDQRGLAITFEHRAATQEAALLSFIETGVNYLDTNDADNQYIEQLRTATRVAPDSTIPLVALGDSLLASGDTRLAINAYLSALTLDEDCLQAHQGLCTAFEKLPDPDQAALHKEACRRIEQGPVKS